MGQLYRSVDLLLDGHKRGYGVPAYDTFNYETTKIVFDAAEAAGTPVIIMYYPGSSMPMHIFAQMVKEMGALSKVPFALHLDHSPSFEICMKAIHAGFTSVMIDASKLPFDQNVAVTKQVVQAAHAMGVDVEGELGTVGRNEAVNRDLFTQPDEAARFVEETGIDSLAVAIGNNHGVYIEEPDLDIVLLRRINTVAGVPLVLHGTSMIPVDQLKEAVRNGISKTNIATEYLMYYVQVLKEKLQSENHPKTITPLLQSVHQPIVDFIAAKMAVLNPDNVQVL